MKLTEYVHRKLSSNHTPSKQSQATEEKHLLKKYKNPVQNGKVSKRREKNGRVGDGLLADIHF